ncbi:MAG: hypothetical protein SF066_01640 [Thermoanaerobaculia bacterium]|nr:hypothetical protein [Thermoanaerobaculia bacterium]
MSFRDRDRQEAIERSRSDRVFRRPVGWLLDQQLAVNLKRMVRYSTAGEEIDPRNWMVARELDLGDAAEGREEFWFDYLSDTGDGMKATYGIASLVHSNLFVPAGARPGDPVAFERVRDRLPAGDPQQALPRGELLVVGGDTAYQIADYETLVERFQKPFNWAFEDLEFDDVATNEPRRPIVAIPANHDYYDFLDGFNRQFRRPFNDERRWDSRSGTSQPYLVLDGFKRVQWASYFSVALPFDWRLFGFDAQEGKMDKRQKHFFRDIIENPDKPTQKLILATPEPTTVLGKRCAEDAPIVQTMRDVLHDGLGLADDSCPFLTRDPDAVLRAGQARLDLSGDTHQYARHWGSGAEDPSPASYASVVSGLGGAFLHSTSTDAGQVSPRALYPPRAVALEATVRRNLDPLAVARGGRVPAIGVLASFLVLLGAIASWSVPELLRRWLGHLPEIPQDGQSLMWRLVDMLRDTLEPTRDTAKTVFWHSELVYALLPFAAALIAFLWYRSRKQSPARARVESPETYRWPVWLITVTGVVSAVGIFGGSPADSYGMFKPLTSNLAVLILVATAFLGLTASQLYDEAMLRQARGRLLGWEDKFHLWALWVFTTLSFLLGLNRYGVDSVAVVLTDITFVLVLLGGLVGLTVFGVLVGGALHRWAGKVAFGAFGFLHGVLQLLAPLVLALYLAWYWALAAGLATAVASWAVGRLLPKRLLRRSGERPARRRLGLVLFALGLLWLAGLAAFTLGFKDVQLPVTGSTLLVAMTLGAVLSCTTLGWYLAVSLCFDGHNGEAGGAARIEKFKQFIRFRVTPNELTGYVIGFDEPKERYEELSPKLIDVFRVRVKGT